MVASICLPKAYNNGNLLGDSRKSHSKKERKKLMPQNPDVVGREALIF